MKKILSIVITMIILMGNLFAQVPQKFNYQVVARDGSGNLIANQNVSFRISILQGSASGTVVYMETHQKTTNTYGLATLAIGAGTEISGNFSIIDWGNDGYYFQTEMDTSGGTSYVFLGTSQFLSVPYALYAKSSGSASPGNNPGDMLYWNGTDWFIVPAGTNEQQLYYCDGIPVWGGCHPLITTDTVTIVTHTSATCGGNVTNNGGSPVIARGVCWSTSVNPTTADSHTTDGSGTGMFVSSLTDLTTNILYYVRAYATNGLGTAYGNEVSVTTLLGFTCGSSITIEHVAGTVAPVTKTVTYGTVTNIPGEPAKCWITSNLGSDHQAIAVNDDSEASAGWYWQFNRKQGYKNNDTTRTPNTTWITSINEYADWNAANDPCTLELGSGWRLPTYAEWTNVDASGGWDNWNGTWNSDLKLHASGWLSISDGALNSRGSIGRYWSSNQTSEHGGWELIFGNNSCHLYPYFNNKALGFPIRCVKE